jgi:hypothetical protein
LINILATLLITIFSCSTYASDASSTDASKWKSYDSVLKSLPKDAAKALDDVVTCKHLSGEFDGDLEHDQGIIKLMNKFKCDNAENRFASVNTRYKNKPEIQKAFHNYYEY